jgi:membrane fusion protein (multidrug efflux system)
MNLLSNSASVNACGAPRRPSGVLRSVLLLPLLCAVLAACGQSTPGASDGKSTAGKSGPGAPGAAAQALPVGVLEVAMQRVPVMLESVGRAEGSREVEVRARVTGVLQTRAFAEGEPVAAGAVMYRLDRAPFEIALAQARAGLDQERARVERARGEAARLAPLARERAISQRELDDAQASLKQLESAVAAAEARVREAELNLSYTTIQAPIAGLAGRSLRSEGSLITAGSDSSLLTTLIRTDPIWVRFSLSEPEFARLRGAGRSAAVSLLMADGSTFPAAGRINFAGAVVDGRLGTVQVRAEFPNPGLALLPGQFARARVQAGEQDGVLVPQRAVLRNEQGSFVWVIGADGKAQPRPVVTAHWVGPDWVIREGLATGDRVIVDNLIKVRPGMAVQVRPAAPAKDAQTSSAKDAQPSSAKSN